MDVWNREDFTQFGTDGLMTDIYEVTELTTDRL